MVQHKGTKYGVPNRLPIKIVMKMNVKKYHRSEHKVFFRNRVTHICIRNSNKRCTCYIKIQPFLYFWLSVLFVCYAVSLRFVRKEELHIFFTNTCMFNVM